MMRFKYVRSTKGAHVFQEVDEHGEELPFGEYKVGTMYFRKSAMPQPLNGIIVEANPTTFTPKPQS